jgi:hypothetical protein
MGLSAFNHENTNRTKRARLPGSIFEPGVPIPERSQIKEKSRTNAGLFPFEKTGCLLDMLESRAGSVHKILPKRLWTCSSFFATPTRLAVGLGTKDYPRAVQKLFAPVSTSKRFDFGSPAPLHNKATSVINFSTIQ